jgi:hypothetical protein
MLTLVAEPIRHKVRLVSMRLRDLGTKRVVNMITTPSQVAMAGVKKDLSFKRRFIVDAWKWEGMLKEV